MSLEIGDLPWTPEDQLPSVFPVIDVEEIENQVLRGSVDVQDAALQRLRDCVETGFLYVKNFGYAPESFDSFVTKVKNDIESADTDLLEKVAVKPPILRGYTSFCGESTAKALNNGEDNDLCWKYTWGIDNNVSLSEEFGECFETHFQQRVSLAQRLVELFGRALNLSRDMIDSLKDGEGVMRFLSYSDVDPELCTDDPRSIRMGQHPDLDTLTLLYQQPSANGQPSLQAFIDDEWIDVPPVRGTIVINFGETLSSISEKGVKATYHRVVCPTSGNSQGSARVAIPLFFQPKREMMIPLPKSKEFAQHFPKDVESVTFDEFFNVIVSTMRDKQLI